MVGGPQRKKTWCRRGDLTRSARTSCPRCASLAAPAHPCARGTWPSMAFGLAVLPRPSMAIGSGSSRGGGVDLDGRRTTKKKDMVPKGGFDSLRSDILSSLREPRRSCASLRPRHLAIHGLRPRRPSAAIHGHRKWVVARRRGRSRWSADHKEKRHGAEGGI